LLRYQQSEHNTPYFGKVDIFLQSFIQKVHSLRTNKQKQISISKTDRQTDRQTDTHARTHARMHAHTHTHTHTHSHTHLIDIVQDPLQFGRLHPHSSSPCAPPSLLQQPPCPLIFSILTLQLHSSQPDLLTVWVGLEG